MIARLIIRLIPLCLLALNFVSKGVVKKEELLARWSFDEGNGTHTVETSGSGVNNATLIGAGWGSGVNAVSQGSLDLSHLTRGIYFIKGITNSGTIHRKIILN